MLRCYMPDPHQVKKVVDDYLDPAKKLERMKRMRTVNDLAKLQYDLNTGLCDLGDGFKEFSRIVENMIING